MSSRDYLQKFMAQQTGLSPTPLLEEGLIAAIGPGNTWALTELGLDMLNGEYAKVLHSDHYCEKDRNGPRVPPDDYAAQQESLNAQARLALEADWTSDFLTKFKASNPASSQQVGGDHYRKLAIQPAEFIEKNHIPFLDGCVIKRMCRHEAKAGVEDLRKAIHEIRLIMQLRYGVSE